MPRYASESVSLGSYTELDLAYAAGLIDGEGCLFAYPRGATGIQVQMTEEAPIKWLLSKFSGNYRTHRPKNSAWKLTHSWALQRQADLRFLLPQLQPFFLVKDRASVALLEYLEYIRNKPTGADVRNKQAPYYQKRAQLLQAIKDSR